MVQGHQSGKVSMMKGRYYFSFCQLISLQAECLFGRMQDIAMSVNILRASPKSCPFWMSKSETGYSHKPLSSLTFPHVFTLRNWLMHCVLMKKVNNPAVSVPVLFMTSSESSLTQLSQEVIIFDASSSYFQRKGNALGMPQNCTQLSRVRSHFWINLPSLQCVVQKALSLLRILQRLVHAAKSSYVEVPKTTSSAGDWL